jgi:GNAT superfamily N-acetyltransferase
VRFWRAGLPPYDGDPRFVVPLLHDCLARWNPRGAFFRHADVQHFVAVRDGRDVGRVAACVDRIQDEVHGDRTGLFGWFETEDRRETAAALLDAAAAWLRERGRDRIRGPLSYTTNGVAGLLVEDLRGGPPVLDMAYNPPGYAGHLEAWGLAKARDLVALLVRAPKEIDERIVRITRRVLERGRFRIRPIRTDSRGFAEDVERVLAVYNGAWERNWGFVPLTPDEIREQAAAFRPLLVPDLLLFAEQDDRTVAFSLTLPDFNVALHRIRGRLWPWSVLTLMRWRRKIHTTRTITLGVLPEFRRTGLDAALIHETMVRGMAIGFDASECSWILEDNLPMIQAVRQAGGVADRRYRVYERTLET